MGALRARCDVEDVLVQLQTLLPIVLLIGVFYLLILRPARTRQKAQQQTISALSVGKQIMTTGGLFGTVTAIDGDRIEIEIADGVRVQYLQAAVSRVVTDSDAPDAPVDVTDDDEDDNDEDRVELAASDATNHDVTGGDTQNR
ncbi:MAG TPA: preprotein translocase subunit YajC [Candidatus Nanopelagicales bacterium]